MKLELVDQRAKRDSPPLADSQLASLVSTLGDAAWVVNLVLVEDHVMADLNGRWYGGEGPTDVLSFSYLEPEGPGAPHLAGGTAEAARDLWVAPGEQDSEVTAGEIIVAPGFVAGRCGREGWDLATEWALLLVHGGLHVLGWEHDTAAARRAMRAREAELLSREGYTHPLPDSGTED